MATRTMTIPFANICFNSLHSHLHTTKFKFTIWTMKNQSSSITCNVKSSVSCKYSQSIYYFSLANDDNAPGIRHDSMAQHERIWYLELVQCSMKFMSGRCLKWMTIKMALLCIAWSVMKVSFLVYDSATMVPCWLVYQMIAQSMFGL